MPRLPHGKVITENAVRDVRAELVRRAPDALLFAAAPEPDVSDFDYMFPGLQNDPAALLPISSDTVSKLKTLGESMFDDGSDTTNSTIPAAYTYFGQFVDHDVTLETKSGPADVSVGGLLNPGMEPMSVTEVRASITNMRTATLDLDSLYGGDARRDPNNDQKMDIGDVTVLPNNTQLPFKRPLNKATANDVPRRPRDSAPGREAFDRAALIGDPRNDENTIISQLQVAFLKAHNRLVDAGYSFDQARRILRQHYQQIVVHDFLEKRIADETVVRRIVADGNKFYNGLGDPFFLPLEFTVAAYRVGHTMVRGGYDFNLNFNTSGDPGTLVATVELLFSFTALVGELGDHNTLPENWIIEWEKIIGDNLKPAGMARKVDTHLAAKRNGTLSALYRLTDLKGTPLDGHAAQLAVRNLLRGYRLRIPTGQAIAAALNLPALTSQQIKDAANSAEQVAALEAGNFDIKTPLWFYVLAEAAHHGGHRLGPVGSTIVAEVLVGLARRSEDSILRVPGWMAALPSAKPGEFQLSDLLNFAGVLGDPMPFTTYVVRSGDSLSSIAQRKLGDANRWPEIFASNRTILRHPDRIFPGQRLILPSGPALDPQPHFVAVEPGDTLSELAAKHLGDANRWREIFKLNSSVISHPDTIFPDQVLLLPPD